MLNIWDISHLENPNLALGNRLHIHRAGVCTLGVIFKNLIVTQKQASNIGA